MPNFSMFKREPKIPQFLLFVMSVLVSVLFILLPSSSWAAITLVQTKDNNSSSGLTWQTATTAGNFLVVTVTANGASGMTITPPSGWSTATSVLGSSAVTYIFYKENAASQTSTGSFTVNGNNTNFYIIGAEYSGVAASSSLDKTATNTGGNTTPSSGTTATTTQANELLVVGLSTVTPVNSFSNPTNSFTMEDTITNPTPQLTFLDRIVSSTGAYSGGATISPTDGWSGAIATFKAKNISISGTVYTDEGITTMGAGRTVAVSINGGASAGTALTAADGTYTISGLTVNSGDVLTLYLSGNTEKGTTVTVGTGSSLTGIDIYQNDLIARCDNSCSLTNSNLNSAAGNGSSDISAIYSVTGSALTVAAGKSFFIPSSQTFAPGGNVNVGGNFTNNGTYTKGTETLTLTGTGSQNFTPGSTLYNVTVNGLGGTYTLKGGLTASNVLTITAGTLNASSQTITLSGSGTPFSISGTFTPSTSTVNYTGDGATTITGSTYYNLQVGNATTQTAGRTYTLGGDVTVTNKLTVGPASGTNVQTLDGSSHAITLSGTGTVFLMQSEGSYSASTSSISITDTSSSSKTFSGGGQTYYNLSITAGGSGAVIIIGSNTFNNFTINAPKTVTFPSSATQHFNGTFSATGSSGNIITINSSSSGVSASLSKLSGTVSADYLSVKDSAAAGGSSWYAGCNSTNVSGNSGWIFTDAAGCGGPLPSPPPPPPPPPTPSGGQPGMIEVDVTTQGGDGTFNFKGLGPSYSDFVITTIGGSGSNTQNNIAQGNYEASEIVPDGWTKTNDTCSNITVVAGQTAVCSITNVKSVTQNPPLPPNKETGTIVVTKKTIGGDDVFSFATAPKKENNSTTAYSKRWPFSLLSFFSRINVGSMLSSLLQGVLVSANNYPYSNFSISTKNGSGQNSQNVSPGIYSATEDAKDGWTKIEDNCGNITVVAGQTSSCSITNEADNPYPSIQDISPASVALGSGRLTLSVNGGGFIEYSTVMLNGVSIQTTYVSSNLIEAVISAVDLEKPGIYPIAVKNPGPGGGISKPIMFEVRGKIKNKPPFVSGIIPDSAKVGDPDFILTVNGDNFTKSSTVIFNGSVKKTSFVFATQLTALITSSDLNSSGTFYVAVDSGLTEGNSNSVPFTVSAKTQVPANNINTGIENQAVETNNGGALSDKAKALFGEIKKFIGLQPVSLITKLISTVGAVATTAVTALTIFSFAPSLSDLFLNFVRLWGSLLAVFGIRKRIKNWGIVYDSVTKQPLDPAYVILKDANGKDVATAITDIDGRYGFLAIPGIYQITAQKTNYSFPSKKVEGKTSDEIYNDLYFGQQIEIRQSGDTITKNIPLDPVKFDWNEFAKKNKTFMKFYSKWDLALRRIYDVSFVIGFAVSIVAFIFAPYPYNTIILTVYLILLLLRILGLKPKSVGYIIDKSTGIPLSFAVLRIIAVGSNVEISHKITDKYGRYYCLVPRGRYYVKVEKKKDDGSYSLIYTSKEIDARKNGIIKKKFEV